MRAGRPALGGHVLFDLFGEVVHFFRAQVDACLMEALFQNVAYVVLDMAQSDVVTHFLRNAFDGLSMLNLLGGFVIKRGTCSISSWVSHISWWMLRMGRSMTDDGGKPPAVVYLL